MNSLLPTLVAAGLVAAAWICWHWRFRVQRRRLEAYLEWLASGGASGRTDFLRSGSLSPLLVPLEKVTAELDHWRAQYQKEAFNLQRIMGSMEEGVMVVDNRHVLRLVNPSFVRMFQLKHDPLGLTVLHTLRDTTVQEIISAALETGEPQSAEFQISGSKPPRYIAVNVVSVLDTTDRPSALAIFRDISRLKQLEEVRREFVANVSHELRTPLSIFHGYVENLIDNPDIDRKDLTSILLILRRHSQRLNALLEDLLLLARLEARTMTLKLEPIDLADFVNTVARDWTAKLEAKGVSLEVDIAKTLPHLPADPLRLEQVFSNLLENALKYTASGGKIVVQSRMEGSHMVLRIADTGTGILPQDLPHIFERFYRADKSRTRELGGTGLGLSIVKHIVQSHGGSAHAESVYGQGTTIVLSFPMVHLDSKPAPHDLAA
jgi:two-component system phosphate regulon sensor histidine kinase PhoR